MWWSGVSFLILWPLFSWYTKILSIHWEKTNHSRKLLSPRPRSWTNSSLPVWHFYTIHIHKRHLRKKASLGWNGCINRAWCLTGLWIQWRFNMSFFKERYKCRILMGWGKVFCEGIRPVLCLDAQNKQKQLWITNFKIRK